eukprot:SAG11_NODE_779_length_7207_cov_3.043894_3_plen_130_part_00
MKDSCPQVSPASLAKSDDVRRAIRECARCAEIFFRSNRGTPSPRAHLRLSFLEFYLVSLPFRTQLRLFYCLVARDPIAWRAELVATCLEAGEASVSTQKFERAVTTYEHGLRVIPSHDELNAGLLATRR